MSQDLSSPNPIQPLSVGNVVSAGLRLYRSHLKSYFQLALRAYLWLFIPVYGWAKFSALMALIARLAFSELADQPESVEAGRRHVNSRLWLFLLTALLMSLIGVGVVVGASILVVVFAIPLGLLARGGGQSNPGIIFLIVLFGLLVGTAFLAAVLWFSSRFLIVEVPLAIEDEVDAVSTISRSWELTKGHAWRIVGILTVAYLITLPILIPVQVVSALIQVIVLRLPQQDAASYLWVVFLLRLCLSFLAGTLIMPFWQAIKAVVYYDLRSRREGLGLKLRDRPI